MSTIHIKHRHTGAVLYEHHLTDAQHASGLAMRAALDAAVECCANLRGADLSGAKGADLAIAVTRILPEGDLIGWKSAGMT